MTLLMASRGMDSLCAMFCGRSPSRPYAAPTPPSRQNASFCGNPCPTLGRCLESLRAALGEEDKGPNDECCAWCGEEEDKKLFLCDGEDCGRCRACSDRKLIMIAPLCRASAVPQTVVPRRTSLCFVLLVLGVRLLGRRFCVNDASIEIWTVGAVVCTTRRRLVLST